MWFGHKHDNTMLFTQYHSIWIVHHQYLNNFLFKYIYFLNVIRNSVDLGAATGHHFFLKLFTLITLFAFTSSSFKRS